MSKIHFCAMMQYMSKFVQRCSMNKCDKVLSFILQQTGENAMNLEKEGKIHKGSFVFS
jgi:hypothetical protein